MASSINRATTVYFDGETVEKAFKSHAYEFMESQSQSWQSAAFLCKQAVGYAVYQQKTGALSFLLDVVLTGSKYASACRKLIAALFNGCRIDGEKYIINGKLRLAKDKGTGLYNVPAMASAETFKQALETLQMNRKQCGAQFSEIDKALTQEARPEKQWTLEDFKKDIVKRYTSFASETDKAAIQNWMASILK